MPVSRERRFFDATQAAEAAAIVADEDETTGSRTFDLIPRDREAANAAIAEFARYNQDVRSYIRRAMRGASSSAAQLSDDPFQGLAELLQNSDDLSGTEAVFIVDEDAHRLMFAHNGSGLTLHDVLALSVPWLSQKANESELLGRYGIGLSTLRSLSDTIEVHEGHFHFQLQGQRLSALDSETPWPSTPALEGATCFSIPLSADISTAEILGWLRDWDEAGLVFLANVNSVRLLNGAGSELLDLRIIRGDDVLIPNERGDIRRHRVSTVNGREWMVYSQRPASPDVVRAAKAKSATTPISLAFPLFDGDTGHVHIGLPVRPIGLPFRVQAQFDPVTNRRDINGTPWSLALVPILAELWVRATLDLFAVAPTRAWSVVPLRSVFEEDQLTSGKLRKALDKYLLTDGRATLAAEAMVDGGYSNDPLSLLSFEAEMLEPLIGDTELRQITPTPGILPRSSRSADGRWRAVLSELSAEGANIPAPVGVDKALKLLNDSRDPAFVTDLLALAVAHDMSRLAEKFTCLLLQSGGRKSLIDLRGMNVIIPEESSALWGTLGLGVRLDARHRTAQGWRVLSNWLTLQSRQLENATDVVALKHLSHIGDVGETLSGTLTDQQVLALRDAIEAAGPDIQNSTGTGIGRAVRVSTFGFSADGTRTTTDARPSEAYLIENDPTSWHTAAAQTSGLMWISRHYQERILRATGGTSLGAQKFFGLLGAERAPRLVDHTQGIQKYGSHRGVSRWAHFSPARRIDELGKLGAEFTLGDKESPDLESVLSTIAAERSGEVRRKRTYAMLATLGRAWPRLADGANVTAATAHHRWNLHGNTSAWWIHQMASFAWLESEDGRLAAPADLRMRSASTQFLHGDDPARYVASTLVTGAPIDILRQIGVTEQAAIEELIEKLQELRNDFADAGPQALEKALPIYAAIAAQLTPAGGITASNATTVERVRRPFSSGGGLIITELGWRNPGVVYAGPAIFRGFVPFVPVVAGGAPLWKLLRINPPGPAAALAVLKKLSSQKSMNGDALQTMRECLSSLADAPRDQLRTIKKLPVWVGDRWTRERPVYVLNNPLAEEKLAKSIPIWAPGGPTRPYESLIEPLGLKQLDITDARLVRANDAVASENLSAVFASAVDNLQADLATGDPETQSALLVSWDDLRGFEVRLIGSIELELENPSGATFIRFETRAWLDTGARTLYVVEDESAGQMDGGYAIAGAFEADPRRLMHAWVVAWSEASRGQQQARIETAATQEKELRHQRELEADEREQVDSDNARLAQLSGRANARRSRASRSAHAQEPLVPPALQRTSRAPLPVRNLVDPERLSIMGDDGELIRPARRTARAQERSRVGLREPVVSSASSGSTRSGPVNYTPQEREDAGMEVVRMVFGLKDQKGLADLRAQRGVGADAVDELRNFFELKVHAGAIPDQIRLQNSEVERAYETEKYFLVLVGNIEDNDSPTEVRVITNPHRVLNRKVTGHISFSGVNTASSLRYLLVDTTVENDANL